MSRRYFLILMLIVLCCTQGWSKSKIRVMSFNIRQDNVKDGPLNLWQDRKDPLCKYVNKVKPDVVGMQEVFRNQLQDVANQLKGYAWTGAGREDGKEKGEYSPIFYNTKKYELEDKGFFWLSETSSVPSISWGAKYPRIATWVILKEKKTGKKFFYCNSHFDHKSEQAKTESAKFIKAQFKHLCKGLPIIFTADCNTYEPMPTYFTMCDYSYPLQDTWKTALKKKGGPSTSHSWGKNENILEHKIDFIFVDEHFVATKSSIDDASLGGGRYTSDHNAIWADLLW